MKGSEAEPGFERLEGLAAGHELVAEAVALPMADGGRPWLVVRPDLEAMRRRGFVIVYEALRFHLETAVVRLPLSLRPRGWTVARGELPRDGDGRPDRERLLQELGRSPTRVWPPNPVVATPLDPQTAEVLAPALAQLGRNAPVVREHDLELDLGFDSLDRLMLFFSVAEATGEEVSEEELGEIRTVGDLVDLFSEGGRPLVGPLAPRPDLLTAGHEPDRRARWLLRPARLSWLGIAAARPFVKAWVRRRLGLKVVGSGQVDWDHRPLILVANHQSHADSLMIALAGPARIHRQLFFLGFSGYFAQGWGKLAARAFRIQPVSADDRVREALSLACRAVDAGRVLCIYPEGERTWTGALGRFRAGVSLIARQTGARALPVAVTGAYQFWPRGWPKRWRRSIRIDFGHPVPPPSGTGRAADAAYLATLRGQLAELMRRAGADPVEGDPRVFERGPWDE